MNMYKLCYLYSVINPYLVLHILLMELLIIMTNFDFLRPPSDFLLSSAPISSPVRPPFRYSSAFSFFFCSLVLLMPFGQETIFVTNQKTIYKSFLPLRHFVPQFSMSSSSPSAFLSPFPSSLNSVKTSFVSTTSLSIRFVIRSTITIIR